MTRYKLVEVEADYSENTLKEANNLDGILSYILEKNSGISVNDNGGDFGDGLDEVLGLSNLDL